MKPIYRVEVAGANLTEEFNRRLISITVDDEAGFKNDRLNIVLDDREPPIVFPNRGDVIKLSIGLESLEKNQPGLPMTAIGQFTVDEYSWTYRPRTLTITGHANDTANDLKGPRDEHYEEDEKLGSIIEKIAGRHGLEPVIADEYKEIEKITSRYQVGQSDAAYLLQLATETGAIFKVVQKKLYFGVKGEIKSLGGASLPKVTINVNGISSFSYLNQSKSKYKTVEAVYGDKDAGEVESVVAQSEDDTVKANFRIPSVYPNKESAQKAAESKLLLLNSTGDTASVAMQGDPRILAESIVTFVGLRPGIPTKWEIVKVSHSITKAGGFTTSMECEVTNKV